MKTLELIIDAKKQTGVVWKQGTALWAHINGRTVVYEPETARSQKRHKMSEDPLKITAPMPGKIIKVLCGAGDAVTSGQTLVVMEAMKMEYALKAHIEGTVETLLCKEGSQAGLGDLLVQLKEK